MGSFDTFISSKTSSILLNLINGENPPELTLKSALIRDSKDKDLTNVTRKTRQSVLATNLPTRLDNWIRFGAGKFGTCPDDGMPQWKDLPLARKLFVRPRPPNVSLFYRQRLGRSLWPKTKPTDFRLYDMKGIYLHLPYEDCHDPHLRDHLHTKPVQERLKQCGDLHGDLVICDLKRMNRHREFLRQLNVALVIDSIRKEEEEKKEKLMLERNLAFMSRRCEKLEQQQLETEARQKALEDLEMIKKKKLNKLKQIEIQWRKQIEQLFERRFEKYCERLCNGKAAEDRRDINLMKNEAIRAVRLANFKRKWREREEKYARNLQRIKKMKEITKEKEIMESWLGKIDAMTRKMESDMLGTMIWLEMKKINENARKQRAENVKKRQETLIEKLRIKEIHRREENYRERLEKNLKQSIINAWMKRVKKPEEEDAEYYRIVKSVNIVLADIKLGGRSSGVGSDRYVAMIMSIARAEKEREYPVEVSYALDFLLENVIKNWARKLMREVVEGVLEQVIEYGLEKLNQIRTKNRGLSLQPSENVQRVERGRSSSTLRKDSSLNQAMWDLREPEIKTKSPIAEIKQSAVAEVPKKKPKKRGVRMIDMEDEEDQQPDEETLEKHPLEKCMARLRRRPSVEDADEIAIDSKKWDQDYKDWEQLKQQRLAIEEVKEVLKNERFSENSVRWKETFRQDAEEESEKIKSIDSDSTKLKKILHKRSTTSERKRSSGIQFGDVNIIKPTGQVPADGLKPIAGRRLTPVPSHIELAALVQKEKNYEELLPQMSNEERSYTCNKEIFQKLCEDIARKLCEKAKIIIDACIEPITRYRVLAKLSKVQDAHQEELVEALINEFLTKKAEVVFNGELFAWASRGIARDASNCLFLNIPIRQPNVEVLNRVRIMCMKNGPRFYIKN